MLDRGFGALVGAAAWVAPAAIAELSREVEAKLLRIPTQLNEYGYDPWGFHPTSLRRVMTLLGLLYRYYFRVQLHGIENLPGGRLLVIANHAGQLPLDAAMIMCATLLEAEPPRMLRGMAEYWLPTLPFIGTVGTRIGSVVGTPKNCIDLLRRDEAVIAFPEGARGLNKLYRNRYRLEEFGMGFMRLALDADCPIVPVAVVGSEEQAPALANLQPLARLIGAPAFPITPFFPALGLLGTLPLPVKYHIYFGEPMGFNGNGSDEDAIVGRKVQSVKEQIQSMIERGLRARRSIFY